MAKAETTTTTQAQAPPRPPPALDRKAIFYMCLLALQFGVQPVLTRRYTPPGITRSTVILTQEVVKFGIAWAMLRLSGAADEAVKGKILAFYWNAAFFCGTCH